jgi:serine phosphatase RsbU (regulator of sigma subunit)
MVTAACCVFDPNTMTLSYATAGHPPPVIVPAAEHAFTLPNGGPPLGVVGELELQSLRYPLGSGALLVLYTDGLIEECRDVLLSERALLVAAERSAPSRDPAGEIFATLLADGHARDDVAIITMRVDGSPGLTGLRPHMNGHKFTGPVPPHTQAGCFPGR